MRRRPLHIRLPPPSLPLLLLLPFVFAASAVLRPCRTWLAIGRWNGAAAPFSARRRIPNRSSLSEEDHTTAEAQGQSVLWLKVRSRRAKQHQAVFALAL
mmetsp:Transcript_89087/g.285592  ORF Transcript_89087/g.285592 Transcript_89087/m.285592 type:complete len:99 (+) Transcript_89087:45-341(+)